MQKLIFSEKSGKPKAAGGASQKRGRKTPKGRGIEDDARAE